MKALHLTGMGSFEYASRASLEMISVDWLEPWSCTNTPMSSNCDKMKLFSIDVPLTSQNSNRLPVIVQSYVMLSNELNGIVWSDVGVRNTPTAEKGEEDGTWGGRGHGGRDR